jgi:hypothetical protein
LFQSNDYHQTAKHRKHTQLKESGERTFTKLKLVRKDQAVSEEAVASDHRTQQRKEGRKDLKPQNFTAVFTQNRSDVSRAETKPIKQECLTFWGKEAIYLRILSALCVVNCSGVGY